MNKYLQVWDLSADDFPADGFASDQLEFLLRYAILAPSTHNTQPWLFRINMMDVEIFADWRRALRVIDPSGRELVMSCGAALFNLQVATEYFGHLYKLKLLPNAGNPDLMARFELGLPGEMDGGDLLLFRAMTQRRTNRQPFLENPVPEALLEAWGAAASQQGAWFRVLRDSSARLEAADLVAEGDKRQWADKEFRAELARWVRVKGQERGDGLPVSTQGVKDWLSFAGPAMIRTFDRGGGRAASDRDIALHSPVLAVIGTDTDDTLAWLNAGQALQRVLLGARTEDVWASFLNQPIEVPDLRERLAGLCGSGGFPQVLLRLGYGPEAEPMPRRSLREVLVMQTSAHP